MKWLSIALVSAFIFIQANASPAFLVPARLSHTAKTFLTSCTDKPKWVKTP